MNFRQSNIHDIPQIQVVRNSVKENMLSNPALVSDQDCEEYMFRRGKGWVCEIDGYIIGFAIADLQDYNIWALFVHPDHEKKGIGRRLHDTMLAWYFQQTDHTVWLSTSPGTRAEQFYRLSGWKETGLTKSGEIRFEMEITAWEHMTKA